MQLLDLNAEFDSLDWELELGKSKWRKWGRHALGWKVVFFSSFTLSLPSSLLPFLPREKWVMA